MLLIKSMLSAFLMYSRIPVPQIEWKEENRKYSLCFFPLVGAVIGGLLILLNYICSLLEAGRFLFSVSATALPVLVTGGIHLDGFCDVSDARASCAGKAEKLKIMSDSHIGAFAVINLCIYFLLQTGLFSELYGTSAIYAAALGFIMSRSLSAFAAVTFKSAKSTGALQNFSKPADKIVSITVSAVIFGATVTASVLTEPFCGILSGVAALIVLLYYRCFSYRCFGGITGDLAGWFLQICELAVLAVAAISEVMFT